MEVASSASNWSTGKGVISVYNKIIYGDSLLSPLVLGNALQY